MARQIAAAGHKVIVRDPVAGTTTAGGGWPDSALVFTDDYDWLEYMHDPKNGGAVVIVDEAGDLFGVSDRDLHWMFTKGRHYGYAMMPICQRPKMVAPNVRGQCGKTYMFRLAQEDAREIGMDMGFSDMHKIELDRGDFLVLESGTPRYSRGNVFQLTGIAQTKGQL